MKTEHFSEGEKHQREAQRLLTYVSNLLEKAGATIDPLERRALYLQAMEKTQKAYDLLGKARRSGAEFYPAEKEETDRH